MKKIQDATQGVNFLTSASQVLCHETMHTLLNEMHPLPHPDDHDFDAGEHTVDADQDGIDNLVNPNEDPDDRRDLMYMVQPPNWSEIVWLNASLRRIDLTRKEGVER